MALPVHTHWLIRAVLVALVGLCVWWRAREQPMFDYSMADIGLPTIDEMLKAGFTRATVSLLAFAAIFAGIARVKRADFNRRLALANLWLWTLGLTLLLLLLSWFAITGAPAPFISTPYTLEKAMPFLMVMVIGGWGLLAVSAVVFIVGFVQWLRAVGRATPSALGA